MLKTRVITAVLLLAALLPGLFLLPQTYWALLAALICGVAAWEWGGLVGLCKARKILFGIFLASICVLASILMPAVVTDLVSEGMAESVSKAVYGLAVVFWIFVVPLWLGGKWQPGALIGSMVGVVVIVPAWLALVQLRSLGPGVLLAVLIVVWVSDIAAYFAGKTFGRHKLAPSISPGKTWEGAMGAGAGVLVYGLIMRYSFGFDSLPLGLWLVGLLAITAVGIIGDLFESLLKRQAGIKDSSQILPGHGGVLDRIDSLTSTLPMVALLWLFFVVKSS